MGAGDDAVETRRETHRSLPKVSEACREFTGSSPKGSETCRELAESLSKVLEACWEFVGSLPKSRQCKSLIFTQRRFDSGLQWTSEKRTREVDVD
ncbi:hypothetical protein BHE74_00011200 [Ensete ventricosum]|uniref:Uncharacterized protein n=1 Tax=Ensete ventricosum TaxID=4639 RepID=A0A426YWI7_ENSVE|nr:hypothetical protein B296_00020645 [Ensete ventricosum]RWW12649.1 hypothetical protein GW17_00023676 [Ensete ventricosum]RWW80460.1 hypothetical protein BHE74_00011200 [Ensete ventricosum]